MSFDIFLNKEIRAKIQKVVEHFKTPKTEEEVFYHFCFTVLVPQTKHKTTVVILKNLQKKNIFENELSSNEIETLVKPARFYRNKTKYLLILKQNWDWIYSMINSINNQHILREFLINEVYGLGMKAASHLMRNLGYDDVAIIDTHIIKMFNIDKKTITKKNYVYYENVIRCMAKKYNLTVVEFDILLWQMFSKTPWDNFVY